MIGNIKLIGNLYINNLLEFKIINEIIRKLLKEDEIKLELLYNLIKIIKYNLEENYHINLKEKIKLYIKNINDLRLEYFFNDLYNNELNTNTVKHIEIKINKNMKLKNTINEFLNHNKLDKTFEYLNEFINDYDKFTFDYINFLFDQTKIDVEKIMNLYIEIYKNYNNIINNVINDIDDIYSYLDDIEIDYPFAINNFNNFILVLHKNKIINDIYKNKYLKLKQ